MEKLGDRWWPMLGVLLLGDSKKSAWYDAYSTLMEKEID